MSTGRQTLVFTKHYGRTLRVRQLMEEMIPFLKIILDQLLSRGQVRKWFKRCYPSLFVNVIQSVVYEME